MVILEHNHARQVVSMGVDASDQHTIFLDEPEPCGGSETQPVVIGILDTRLASSSEFQR